MEISLSEILLWKYLIVMVLLSEFFGNISNQLLNRVTRIEWKKKYTVVIISTLVSLPYIISNPEGWEKILITYTLGTSMHELFLKYIYTFIKNFLGYGKQTNNGTTI